MMDNGKIADHFEELADLMEFRSENPFRVRAYRNGSKAIRDLGESVTAILTDPSRRLDAVPGIGKGLVDQTRALVETGRLPQLEKLRQEVPEIVLLMARIPGLGAKKAVVLHQELKLETLDDLRRACEQDVVKQLKGFAAKTQQVILEGLEIAEAAAERIHWANGDQLAQAIALHMRQCDAITRMEWAGSYRRGRETVGDLDLLVVASDRQLAMDQFESFPQRSQTMMRGDTKVSIRVGKAFQVDLRLVEEGEFGAALQYFTGSQAHNVHVRRIAKQNGLKVNEYGVFRIDDQSRVAGASEEEVYQAIGLPWISPELREDRGELTGDLVSPEDLLEISQLRGDLHMHTTATDGEATIREMAEAAIERGLTYIAITDHSQRVSMAMGLDPKRLREQWRSIDAIRPEYEGRLEILKGIECDILEKGGMDLPDDCLEEADWVLASIHYGQKQSRDQITDRLLGALENPHVDCIAHPTGRLLNRRRPYEVDMEAVMDCAKRQGKLMELNANPARLDLNEVHLAAAKRRGIPIVISTDAHSIVGLDVMRYGVLQARRGGLVAANVANTLDWPEMKRRWLSVD
jgi:DNA polymerase (family 10)